MNCSFCAHASLGAVVAAIMPADTIAAPSSANLRSPIVSSSLIGLAGPCGRPCLETLAAPAQCGKGQSLSFSLATDHKRASPLGSTTRKNTIKAPKIIDSKFDTVAVLIFQSNSGPNGGNDRVREMGRSTMKGA